MKIEFRLLAAVAILFCAVLAPAYGFPAHTKKAYKDLADVVSQRKAELTKFCDSLKEKAQSVSVDPVMRKFFIAKSSYYHLTKDIDPPDDIKKQMGLLKKAAEKHYLANYLEFYDILFIDNDGDVFFTIRKESDYHSNIFQGEFAKTHLAQTLQSDPDKGFVEFQQFAPSDEPAAFFIVPMKDKGKNLGWFVLQCSVNKINSIFMSSEIGLTGEVFLVNSNQVMLTDSRFIGDSTILRKHLSRDNIDSKFKERKGNRVVMDEFAKVNNGRCMHAFGVSTCTCFVVSFPKKFAYMAHISPFLYDMGS